MSYLKKLFRPKREEEKHISTDTIVAELENLLSEPNPSSLKQLLSLHYWSDSIPFTTSEDELDAFFIAGVKELSAHLGSPKYCGVGPRRHNTAPKLEQYFEYIDEALQYAYWELSTKEVGLFHSSHDANSLQFIVLEVVVKDLLGDNSHNG